MSNPYASPNQQNSTDVPSSVAQGVRGLQIITIAMVLGVLFFMAICLVTHKGDVDRDPDIVSWIGLGFAGLMIFNHLVIPSFLTKTALVNITGEQIREADDAKKFELIFPAFRTRHIVAVAMLEGAALFNLVAYMTSQYRGNLGAAVFLVILIGGRITSTTSAMFWVNDRAREIEMR